MPTIATDLGVPRSTARGWLGKAPTEFDEIEFLVGTRAVRGVIHTEPVVPHGREPR